MIPNPPQDHGAIELASDPVDDAADAPPPAQKYNFTLSDIFLGDDGLRAIWAIALFLLFREALTYCFVPLLQAIIPMPPVLQRTDSLIAPRSLLRFEGAGLLCLAGATWLMARIERRSVSVFGFGPQHRLRNFVQGLGWGVALLSLLIAALHAAGLLVFDARLLFGRSMIHFGLIWFGGFVLVSLTEEIYLRGYLQFTLTRGLAGIYRWLFGSGRADALGFWTSAAILSFVFGFGHSSNPGESPLGLLAAGLVGLVFCLSLWRTGSLWWAIGFHAAWDWAQSFLYGVADSGLMVKGHLFATRPLGQPYLSGGLTGPEGSIFLLPVLLVAVAAISFTLPRTHRGYREAAAQPPLH